MVTESPNHRGDLMDHPGLNHHPDLIAAVQEEALRRHGLLLKDWEANAALLYLSAARQPWERPAQRGPAHEAASSAREVWRMERGVWPTTERATA